MNFSGPSSGWSGSAPFPTDSDYRQFANSPDPSSPEFPLRALSQTPFHLRRPDSGLLWAQSPVPNSIQTADHEALIQHGNMTYTRLLCAHSELQGRYSTLEQAYMLLAKTIPQVFHYIPNPMEIPISSPSISTQPSNIAVSPTSTQFCQEDYPQVKFWKRTDYKEASSDLTTVSDDKEATLGFLEHSSGERFNPDEVESARKRARTLFTTMLNKGWAPLTWSQADATATDYFRQDMLGKYPEIGLCASNWKIDLMATIVYGQWTRRRKGKIQEKMDEVSTVKEVKEEKEKRKRKKHDSDGDESNDGKRRRRDDHRARHKNQAVTEPPSSVSADALPETTSIPPALPSTSNSSESFPVRSHPLVPSPLRNLNLDLNVEVDLEPRRNPFGLDLSKLRFTASSPSAATATTANATAPAPVSPVPANTSSNASSNAQNTADSVPTPKPLDPAPSLNSPPETNIAAPVPVVKVNNPLAGKFKSVSRLDPVFSAPPAPPVASTSTFTSSSVIVPASASKETAISALAPTSETETPTLKKAKPHRPGAAHTAWNLFARDHMALAGNGKLSHDEVEAAWKALRQSKPEQEKYYIDKSARMKAEQAAKVLKAPKAA